MEKIAGSVAIKQYFELTAQEAVKECRELKNADIKLAETGQQPKYFKEIAAMCAATLGKELEG